MYTHQKALKINLGGSHYGTFAEIGAGQEVARWFFRVGAASGTIATTVSAYDATVSDAIYGPTERYVSRQRLVKMLDHEYGLLLERLEATRGERVKFFAFADTVAARSFTRREETHGWMGIRFQTVPKSPPSQIIIHVRMLDRENVSQQGAGAPARPGSRGVPHNVQDWRPCCGQLLEYDCRWLSGLIGRYFYVQIPKGIQGNELSVGELTAENKKLAETLTTRFGLDADILRRIDAIASPPKEPVTKIESKSTPPKPKAKKVKR